MALDSGLEAIKAAYESQQFVAAESLADEYVAAHPDIFDDDYKKLKLPDAVRAVDAYRAAGDIGEKPLWLMETWILHGFEFQDIGGEHNAVVRITPDENEASA